MLSDHVLLSITADSVNAPRAGFGTGMVVSYSADWVERVREYTSLAGVASDFPTATSPEYLAAQAYFAQSPRPEKFKIGRGALPPTQEYTITPVAQDSYVYSVTLKGEGVTPTTVTYPSDASATIAEICAGLETAINAVVGKNFTATDNTTDLTIEGDAAGDWFSVEVADPVNLVIEQTHTDPGIATDLTAIEAEDPNWYGLLTNFNSNAMVLAADAWIQTRKKIYAFDVNESEAITTAAGNSDTLDDITTLERARTAGLYHPSPYAMNAAAWMGKKFPSDAGSTTWKFAQLTGVPVVDLTATQRSNLRARNANFYETMTPGINIMSEGTTADGDFIDVVRGLDWLDDEMSKEIAENMVRASQTGKIPYTNAGLRVTTSAIGAVLKRAVDRGFLVEGSTNVVAPDVADISNANKTARTLPDVTFSATLAGAIHKVNLTGVVSV